MDRWVGKVAVVTGASAGIGAAVVKDLVRAGCIVVGCARRVEKIEALNAELEDATGKLYARQCDVTDLDAIKSMFEWIEEEIGPVSIMINNAGVARFTLILNENNEDDLAAIVKTNFLGLIFCAKQAYQSMVKHDVEGYIINVGSVFGHALHDMLGNLETFSLYSPSKFAIRTASEVMRLELAKFKRSKIRVSLISPGLVKTEILEAANTPGAEMLFDIIPHLTSEEVSDEIIHLLSLAPHIQVQDLIFRAVGSF